MNTVSEQSLPDWRKSTASCFKRFDRKIPGWCSAAVRGFRLVLPFCCFIIADIPGAGDVNRGEVQ
jgi:hypothetical protein